MIPSLLNAPKQAKTVKVFKTKDLNHHQVFFMAIYQAYKSDINP